MINIALDTVYKLSVLVNMVDNLTKPAQIAYQGLDDSIEKTQSLLESTGGKSGFIESVKEGAVEAGERITESLDNPIKKTTDLIRNGDFKSGLFSSIETGSSEAGRAVESNVDGSIKKAQELLRNTDGKKGFFSTLKDGAVEAGQSISSTLSSLKDKIFNVKNLITGMVMGAGTKKIFDGTVGNAASFEQYETSFKVMMGSADQAKSKLKELSDYANTTPFQLPEVVQAGRTLMTFGLDTGTWVKNAGNLAAAANTNIADVATAMGRIKAGDFGEAFERMRDFGISKQMLEAQGLKFDKSGQYVGSVDQALNAVNTIVNQKFGGMTEAQGKTFNGLMSTFQDSLSSFGREIGQKAFPAAKDALQSLMAKMDEMSKNGSLDKFATLAGNAISHIATDIVKLVDIIGKVGSFVSSNWNIIEPILVALGTMIASMMIAKKINDTITAFNNLKTAAEGMKEMSTMGAMFKSVFGFGPQALIAIGIITAVAAIAFLVIKNWGPISNFFKNLWKDIQGAFAGVGQFFEGIWNGAKNAFNTFWDWLKGFVSKWGVEILAVIAPFIGIPLLIVKHWDDIKAGLNAAWQWIKSTASSAFNGIAEFFKSVWQGISNIFTSVINVIVTFVNEKFSWLVNGVRTIFDGFKSILQGIWNAIKLVILGPVLLIIDLVTGNFTKLKSDAIKILEGLRTAFGQIWQGIRTVFTGAVMIIVGYLTSAWNGLVNTGKAVWNGFKSFMSSLWTGIVNLARTIWNGLVTFLVGLWHGITSTAVAAWNGLKSAVSSIITGTVSLVISIWNGIINFFASLPGRMYNLGVTIFTSLKSGIVSILSTLSSVISSGFDAAISFITSLPAKALEWGKDFIQGLIDGIKGAIGGITDAVSGVADKIRSFLHFSVPDEGPLTDYESWMPDFLSGMANGIKVNASLVFDKVNDVAVGIKERMSPAASMALPGVGAVKVPIQVPKEEEKNKEVNEDLDERRKYKKIDIKQIIKEQTTEREKQIIKKHGKKVIIQKLEMKVEHIKDMDDFQKQLENEVNSYSEDDE